VTSLGRLSIKLSKVEVISKDILIFLYFNLTFYRIVIRWAGVWQINCLTTTRVTAVL